MKKRKGRPLLVAAAGVAFVSFSQCEPKDHAPVGNLRPVEIDAGPIPPVGNLMANPNDDKGFPDAGPPDTGAPSTTTSDGGGRIIPPVGNLRPPVIRDK